MRRRQFLTAASVTFIPSASATPYQDAAYVRTLATRLGTGLYDHGGIPILPSALRHAQQIRSAIDGTDRALQSAASDVATWAAWVAYDAGRVDMAEHLGRLALALGNRAGDQEAQATACSALSAINIDLNRLDQAVMYARRGIAFQDTTSERRGWMHMRLGQALAQVGGQEYAAREALAYAQGVAEGLQNMVDVADMTYVVGMALGDLHAFDDAHASLNEAVGLSEQCSPLLYGEGLAIQAKTALHAADPELAADRMFVLARVAPLISSSRVDRLRNELLTLSTRWQQVPEIRTARGQFAAIATINRT